MSISSSSLHVATTSANNESGRLIRSTSPSSSSLLPSKETNKNGGGIRMHLLATREIRMKPTNGNHNGFGDEPCNHAHQLDQADRKRRHSRSLDGREETLGTFSSSTTTTTTSASNGNYKLTTALGAPSEEVDEDEVFGEVEFPRRRRRKSPEGLRELAGESRKSLRSVTGGGGGLDGDKPTAGSTSSSCDEADPPRLLIHLSDTSPIASPRSGLRNVDSLSVSTSQSDEEEFEIPVGGIFPIPNKSKRSADPIDRKDLGRLDPSQHPPKDYDRRVALIEKSPQPASPHQRPLNGNEVVRKETNTHSDHSVIPNECTPSVSSTPRARLKRHSAATPSVGCLLGDSIKFDEDSVNSHSSRKPSTLANADRPFSPPPPPRLGESKSGIAAAIEVDSSSSCGRRAPQAPPRLIPSRARAVLRLVSIEAAHSTPEVATTATTRTLVDSPTSGNDGRRERETSLSHTQPSSSFFDQSVEELFHHRRSLAPIRPHQHGADCERRIARIEQTFDRRKERRRIKMISEFGGTTSSSSGLYPNIGPSSTDRYSTKLLGEQGNGGGAYVNSPSMVAGGGGGFPGAGLVAKAGGGNSVEEDYNNSNGTTKSRLGDYSQSVVDRHDISFSSSSNNVASSRPSVLISNKAIDSAQHRHHQLYDESSIDDPSPELTAATSRLDSIEEDDYYSDTMSSRRAISTTASSNGGIARGGGGSYGARFPSPYQTYPPRFRHHHPVANGNQSILSWRTPPRARLVNASEHIAHAAPFKSAFPVSASAAELPNSRDEETISVITDSRSPSSTMVTMMNSSSTAADMGSGAAITSPSPPQQQQHKSLMANGRRSMIALNNATTDDRDFESPKTADHSKELSSGSCPSAMMTTTTKSTAGSPAKGVEHSDPTGLASSPSSCRPSAATCSTQTATQTEQATAARSAAAVGASSSPLTTMTAGGRAEEARSTSTSPPHSVILNSPLAVGQQGVMTATATAMAIGGSPVNCEDLLERRPSPSVLRYSTHHHQHHGGGQRSALASALSDGSSPPPPLLTSAMAARKGGGGYSDISDSSSEENLYRREGLARVLPPGGGHHHLYHHHQQQQHLLGQSQRPSGHHQHQNYPYPQSHMTAKYVSSSGAIVETGHLHVHNQRSERDSHSILPLCSPSAVTPAAAGSVVKRSSSGSSSSGGGGGTGGRQVQVEVAVVQAPVVFGQENAFGSPNMDRTPPAMKDDERVIERCEAPSRGAEEPRGTPKAGFPTVYAHRQSPSQSPIEGQKRLIIDGEHQTSRHSGHKSEGFSELKVPSTPNALLPPLSPTEATGVSSTGHGATQQHHHHQHQQRSSPGSNSSASSTAPDQQLMGATSGSGGGLRRRGSFSNSMQPPKKRFMQSMDDTSCSAILVLDDEAESEKGGRSSGGGGLGGGPSKSMAAGDSPVQQQSPPFQKPSPTQALLQMREAQMMSAMRRSSMPKIEPMDTIDQHHPLLHHQSAFTRNPSLPLSSSILGGHGQHPYSTAGFVYPGLQAPVSMAQANSYMNSRLHHRRSNSTETVAAYDLPAYFHHHQQQQQHQSGFHPGHGGAVLPSASASSFAAPGGCLSNGLPASQAVGIQNRPSLDPAHPYQLPTVSMAQASGAAGVKWSSSPMGTVIPTGFGGLSPILRPPPVAPVSTAAANAAPPPSTTADSSSSGGTNSSGTNQFNLIQEIKNLPQGEQFQISLNNWEWCTVDHVRLPSIYRSGEKFVAVHMVQMRLLAKFPPNVPGEIMRRHTMVSHKMNVMEAWIFNTVNALECKYEYGYQLFTSNDEVVKLADVERFYWAVKAFNLTRMADLYRTEIRVTATLHLVLTAHISSLKGQAELESRSVQNMMNAFQAQAAAAAAVGPNPSSAPAPTSGMGPGRVSNVHHQQPQPSSQPPPPQQQHHHPSQITPQHRHSSAAGALGHGPNVLSPPPNYGGAGSIGVSRAGPLVPGSSAAAAAAGLLAAGYHHHHPSSSASAAAAAAHAAVQHAAAYEAALAQGALLAHHPSPYGAYPPGSMSSQQHHHHQQLLAAAQYAGGLSPSAAAAAAAAAAGLPGPHHHHGGGPSRSSLDAHQAMRLPYNPRHGGVIPRF